MSNKFLKISVAAVMGGTVLTGGVLTAVPAKAETEILFNRFVPAKHPFNVGMFIPWAKDVERVTNGSVKVKFTEKSLAPPPKQWIRPFETAEHRANSVWRIFRGKTWPRNVADSCQIPGQG